MLVDGKSGFKSTAQVIDWARERGRPRNDVYEAVVWSDSVTVVDDEVYLFLGVQQEAIVTPENIDAIRAIASDVSAEDSMRTTDISHGNRAPWLGVPFDARGQVRLLQPLHLVCGELDLERGHELLQLLRRLLAPTMGETTPGLCRTQASATWAGVTPFSFATSMHLVQHVEVLRLEEPLLQERVALVPPPRGLLVPLVLPAEEAPARAGSRGSCRCRGSLQRGIISLSSSL